MERRKRWCLSAGYMHAFNLGKFIVFVHLGFPHCILECNGILLNSKKNLKKNNTSEGAEICIMENYLGHWTSVDFFCSRSKNDMYKFHNRIFSRTIKCWIPRRGSQITCFLVPMNYGEGGNSCYQWGLTLNLTSLFILPR